MNKFSSPLSVTLAYKVPLTLVHTAAEDASLWSTTRLKQWSGQVYKDTPGLQQVISQEQSWVEAAISDCSRTSSFS